MCRDPMLSRSGAARYLGLSPISLSSVRNGRAPNALAGGRIRATAERAGLELPSRCLGNRDAPYERCHPEHHRARFIAPVHHVDAPRDVELSDSNRGKPRRRIAKARMEPDAPSFTASREGPGRLQPLVRLREPR